MLAMLGTVPWSIGRAEVPQHRAKKAIVMSSLVINWMCRSRVAIVVF